ncbi:pyridoxal-phosphate dependent enzyme [Nocardioidaceae bacterium]|nr:pyridoxal-phosphate dependent enzyme [Nocardioidaceae bacterium]
MNGTNDTDLQPGTTPGPVRLMATPTPLEEAPRLAAALGLAPDQLLLKRDDLGGVGAGGNKLRKLEVLCAEATAAGARTLVTTGAAQSNHARATAAVGARLGFDVVLVLAGHPPQHPARGNLLIDELCGATVLWAGERSLAVAADEAVAALAVKDARPFLVPYGGSSATSIAGYAICAHELLATRRDLAEVWCAVGSGGTMAGLVSVLGPARVVGVDTGATSDGRAAVHRLLDAAGHHVDADDLRLVEDQVGEGYGRLSDGVHDAVRLLARTEGVIVDGTYVGRAAAGLAAAARAGTLPDGPVVLLHSGGLPGLLGHPDLLDEIPEAARPHPAG